jgi:hypothetical protein
LGKSITPRYGVCATPFVLSVNGRLHERELDAIGMGRDKHQVGAILFGEGVDLQLAIGKIQTFFGLELQALLRHGCDARQESPRLDTFDRGLQLPVVDVDTIVDLR